MARTGIRQTQVLVDTLTGADINDAIGIWDETDAYSVDDVVWWDGYLYRCIIATAAGAEGVLTAAPPLVVASWVREPYRPYVLNVSAAYGAAESWMFDVLEVDTSGGDITLTLPIPATVSTFADGWRIFVFNAGSNNVILDPNGNLVDGRTINGIVLPSGYLEVAKVDGNLVIIRSKNATADHVPSMKARSWMGF